MKNGLVLVLTGIVIGVGGALMLTRFLTTLLFGIEPTDRVTFVVVSGMFFVIAMVACVDSGAEGDARGSTDRAEIRMKVITDYTGLTGNLRMD